jgi:cysteine desulfuration protein SufE
MEQLFSSCPNAQARYETLIELGRAAPPLPAELKTEANRVPGCQSILYLHAELREGVLHCVAEADALISNGLVALMLSIYSGLTPEQILRNPPHFLERLGLSESLSMTRLQGLASIYRALQKWAAYSLNGRALAR